MHNVRPAIEAVDENLEVASGERRLEAAQDSGGTEDTGTAQDPGTGVAYWVHVALSMGR